MHLFEILFILQTIYTIFQPLEQFYPSLFTILYDVSCDSVFIYYDYYYYYYYLSCDHRVLFLVDN